ncbi:hypothetical protein NFI96_000385 [Prochilodus magdalenae]|nr:hypothetical protein NFI96_000385 [Prochilodus magdalenae]
MLRTVRVNPQTSTKDLQHDLAADGVTVHHSTIQRTLHKEMLYGRVMQRKPFLRPHHKQSRLSFKQFGGTCKTEDSFGDKQCFRAMKMDRGLVFQHDNDPKHTARITKEWLRLSSKGFVAALRLDIKPQRHRIHPSTPVSRERFHPPAPKRDCAEHPEQLYHRLVWGLEISDLKTLQRIVRTAEKIIGVSLPAIMDIYTTLCIRKATSIVDDPIHPHTNFFHCCRLAEVLQLTWVSVTTSTMVRYLDPTEVAQHSLKSMVEIPGDRQLL